MILFTGKHDADVFVRGEKRVTCSPHQQRQLIIMSTPTDCAAGQSSFVDILQSISSDERPFLMNLFSATATLCCH